MSQRTLDHETQAARQAMELGLAAEDVRRALLLREALRERGQDPALAPLLARMLPPAARAQLLRGAPISLPVDHESEALSVRWARRSRDEDPDSVREVLVGCETTRGYAGVLPLPGSEVPSSESQRFLQADATIGGYEIVAEIARGGMGVVYRARDPRLEREVALKVLSGVDDEEARERFAIEARATARLSHPHIVGVQAVGEDGGRPYLVMDLVEGRSLNAELDERGPLEPRRAATLVRDLADALAYAHARAILHRDLKPHNVLVDQQDRARLTDFGLAKEVARGEVLTATGQVLGTPAYMSPEQAHGDPQLIDRRSDVYGLGATLYALLTGRPPFRGATVWNVLDAVAHDPVEPLRAQRPEVEHDLETIVLTCLEKESDQRYGTMQALRDDLQRYLDDQPISARRPSLGERARRGLRRHRRLVAAGLAVAAGLVIAASGASLQAKAANVSAAQDAAREARERYQAAAEAPLAERTGLALRAMQAALLRYEVEGARAEQDLVRATTDFADVAAEGLQWSVGLEALKQAELLERLAGSSRAELKAKREGLERQRAELVQRRLAKVEQVLYDLETGRRTDVTDAVVEITRNPGSETNQLLCERLRRFNDDVAARTLARLLEVAEPTALERAAGHRPIEGVAEAWARFSDPQVEPRAEPAMRAIGQRLMRRERVDAGDRRAIYQVLDRIQGTIVSERQKRVWSALCRSLGQLGAEAAYAILARNFRLWLSESFARVPARALYWLGTPAAKQFLKEHTTRFGGPGTSLYEEVMRRLDQRREPSESELTSLVEQAERTFDSGDLAGALSLLRRAFATALRENPSAQPEVLARIGYVQLAQGDLAEARRSAERALKRAPTLIRGYLVLAEAAVRGGDLEEAARASAEALRLGPRKAEAHALRVEVLIKQEKLDEAGETLVRALELDPNNPRARFAEANLAGKRADWEAALRALDRYLELVPDDHHARVRTVSYCLWTHREREVLARSERLLARSDLSPQLRMSLLDLRLSAGLRLGEFQLAERACAAIDRLDPGSLLAALGRAELALERKQIEEAGRLFAEARRRAQAGKEVGARSQDRLAFLEIQLLTYRGEVRPALALCDQELARHPDLFLVRVLRADLRLKLGDLDGARLDLAVCQQQDPHGGGVLALLASVRLVERRYQESERAFDQLLARHDSPRARLGRAMARLGLKQFQGVIEDANAGIRAGGPAVVEGLLLRGNGHQGLGQLELARRDFEAALRQGNARQQARARRFLAQLPR